MVAEEVSPATLLISFPFTLSQEVECWSLSVPWTNQAPAWHFSIFFSGSDV